LPALTCVPSPCSWVKNSADPSDGAYLATPLGKAATTSSLAPEDILDVQADLERAREVGTAGQAQDPWAGGWLRQARGTWCQCVGLWLAAGLCGRPVGPGCQCVCLWLGFGLCNRVLVPLVFCLQAFHLASDLHATFLVTPLRGVQCYSQIQWDR